MLKIFISLIIMFFSFLMFFINHPLSMGLMILIQTLLLCLLSGLIIKTYWFSYILFLTFLGGLLVLFIYVSSIASNEMFKLPFFMKITLLLFTFIIIIVSMINYFNLKWMNLTANNSDMLLLNYNYIYFNNENKFNLAKLYNNHTFLMMMILIIYLFITLVAIVKITNIFFGPLRPSN